MRAKICLGTWVFVAAAILILSGRIQAQPPTAPPRAFSSVPPVPPPRAVPRETYRLGCQLRSQPEDGLVVTYVRPRAPCTKLASPNDANVTYGLEIGDVVTHVDGIPINSLTEYREAMDAAAQRGGTVELWVRSIDGNREQRWIAQANREQVVAPLGESRVRMVYFLFIGTTEMPDDPLGEGIRYNLESLQAMADTFPKNRVAEIKVIDGNECTKENILQEVASLPLSYDDAVFCHYSGHGAFDPAAAVPDDKSNGHHFQIQSGALMRYQLWTALKKHGIRLTVLMTDTCNVLAKVQLGKRREFTVRADQQSYSNLEQLLLGFRGSIDISASDFNQYAWYSINPEGSDELDRSGGWFTVEVCSILPRYNNWLTAFGELRRATNNDYKERRKRMLADPTLDWRTHDALEKQLEMTPVHFVLDCVRDDQVLEARAAPAEARTQAYSTWDMP